MDAVIRIAAVTSILISCLLLAKSSKNWRWTICLMVLAVSLSAFVVDNGVTSTLRPSGLLEDLGLIFAKLTVGFLWLFLLSTFEEDFRFRPVYLCVAGLWFVLAIAGLPHWNFGESDIPLAYATIAVAFGLIAHAIWRGLNEYSGDLRSLRRQARVWIVLGLSGAVFIDLSVDLGLGFDWRHQAYIMGQNLIAGFSAFILIYALWTHDISDWIGRSAEVSPHKNFEDHLLVKKMRKAQYFLRPDLKFADFADDIPLSAAELRWQINHELGFGHFKSFVNHFRVEHAKALLLDPNKADEKIISIAFDSGFASLPSFQRAFSDKVGMSPTRWKNNGNEIS